MPEKVKIVSPISHLFKELSNSEKITAISDGLECRDHSIDYRPEKQILFHCELQPIHVFNDADWNYLRSVKQNKKHIELISFHMASCCDAPILSDKRFIVGGRVFSKKEMLENAKNNFLKIREIFGEKIIIAVENNNYYATEAYQYITEPDFISEVVNINNIYFLLDIAHAKISAHNSNSPYSVYLEALPLNRTIQIHVCKFDIDQDGIAFDAHHAPDENEFQEVKNLIQKNNSIAYLTVEYYKDTPVLIDSIEQLKKYIS